MIQNTKINNNIYLHYIPMEKLKTTTIGLFIHRPLTKEDASKNALLPHILKRGCKLCGNGEEIAKYLQNLYGATLYGGITKKGNNQVISFEAETISDAYAANNEKLLLSLMDLLLSSVFEPITENDGFNKDIVAQEKANLKDRITSLINDKRSYATMRCTEEMCSDEPAGINKFGNIESVDKIDEKNLYEYYKQIITSSVIDIYICGNAQMSDIENKINEYIRGMNFIAGEMNRGEAKAQKGNIKNVTDRMDVTQGKLAMGFRTNILSTDDDYWALVVANSIFGAGAHSKLFNNVREKLSLAYYASSMLEKYNGLMFVNAGIEFDNMQKAYDEILLQLDNLKNGDISDVEYNSSIMAILNSLESYNDDQNYMTEWYLSQRSAGTEYSIEYMKEQIKKVTIADAANAAKKIELDTVYFLCGKEDN